MKISTNSKELRDLEACSSGYKTFIKAHGDNEVKFSQCLESNGSNDVFWLLEAVNDQLSNQQKSDLRLLACDYALSCLDIFEKAYPNDKRPRLAIEAAQSFARNEITAEELEEARKGAARAEAKAPKVARSAARAADLSAAGIEVAISAVLYWAADAAISASYVSPAESAEWSLEAASMAGSADTDKSTKMLMDLLLKWETINTINKSEYSALQEQKRGIL